MLKHTALNGHVFMCSFGTMQNVYHIQMQSIPFILQYIDLLRLYVYDCFKNV